jgi:hypothetical protein
VRDDHKIKEDLLMTITTPVVTNPTEWTPSIASRHRLRLEVLEVVPLELAEQALAGYKRAYAITDRLAAAAQRLPDEEFLAKMADPTATKFIAIDIEDGPVAMATLTTKPSYRLSAAFYEERWPVHAAEGRIWYMAQFWTSPDHRAAPIAVVHAVASHAKGRDIVIAFNCSDNNSNVPQLIAKVAGRYGEISTELVSVQRYYAYQWLDRSRVGDDETPTEVDLRSMDRYDTLLT